MLRMLHICNKLRSVRGRSTMRCSNCGTENSEGYRFCGSCGTPLFHPNSAVNYVPTTQTQQVVSPSRSTLSGRVQASIVIGALGALALCLCIIGTLVARTIPSPVPSSQVPTTLPIATQLPTFSVIGRDKSSFSLLVPQNTTDEQLAQLIYAFRQARKNNSLGRMGIPATTPGTKYGDYAVVELYN